MEPNLLVTSRFLDSCRDGLRWIAAVLMAAVCTGAFAGDPVAGMALFNEIPDSVISCGNSSCHGPNPNENVNGLQVGGNNAGVIQTAIKMGVTQMMFLNGLLNPFQLDDIAAYLAPQPILSGGQLDFGTQSSGSSSAPQSVTLHNPGGVNLTVTSITVSGAQAADFSVGGSCFAGITLVSTTIQQQGGTCDVSITFNPSSTGSRSGVVTLHYGGATTFPASQTVALSGIGDVALVPGAFISTDAVDFGEKLLNETSTQSTVTISNPGTAALVIGDLSLFGPQAGEFTLSGSCMTGAFPVLVPPSAACDVRIDFTPQGTDVRHAALRIQHNAYGSPAVVSLSGVGIAPTCAPPQPPDEFRTIGCAAGQQGTMTQMRSYACEGTEWTPGSWTTTANQCQASFPPANLQLVEYFNTPLVHYFVTADPAERTSIEIGGAGPGWSTTHANLGRVWHAASDATVVPVCRFYGSTALGPNGQRLGPNSHFYTADPNECAAVKDDVGWIYEGVVFYVVPASFGSCPAPLVAVHRLYNGRFGENDSNHRYTTEPAIVAQMVNAGWLPEGVVFCIAPG